MSATDSVLKDLLHQLMQHKSPDGAELLEKHPTTKKGENYLGTLTSLTLKYKKGENSEETVHIVMKEEPEVSEDMLSTIRAMDLFGTEQKILDEVIPRIEQFVNKKIGPKVYYLAPKPPIIVMEDLSYLGFKNRNKKIGLNANEVNLVLEKLADFHAGTVLLEEQTPGIVSRFRTGTVNHYRQDAYFIMVSDPLSNIGHQLKARKDEKYKEIADKCVKIGENMKDRLFKIYDVDEDELCVLNHGDAWTSNFMFRDGPEGAEEVRFIDYQLPVWSSPAIDLIHFLTISPQLEIKYSNDDAFLDTYLKQLTKTMKQIGCRASPPSMDQLKKSMHKRRVYALMTSLALYPKMLREGDDVETLDDITRKGKSTADPMKDPMARATIEKILPILNERGYLD